MKFILLVTALLASAANAATPPTTGRAAEAIGKLNDSSSSPPPMVFAHRGCWWDEAPENSLASIRSCIGAGIDGIEIDVVRTKDGKLVVMHDLSIDRTTGGSGKIDDMTLAEIRRLRLKTLQGGPDAALTDELVPTLDEVLQLAQPHFIVHIHNKEKGLEADIARAVDRLGMKEQVTVWYNGLPENPRLADSPLQGHIRPVNTINQCADETSRDCLVMPVTDLRTYGRFKPVAFNINFHTRSFLRQVADAPRPAGVRIASNSLSKVDYGPLAGLEAEWEALLDAGVSIILTNRPKDLAAYLHRRAVKQEPLAATLVRKLNTVSGRPPVMVYAHRSCWWEAAPENSIAGIRDCIGTGIDAIEIDVVRTKDGKLVVMHDRQVDRTTNGSGTVADLTLTQIQALRLKARRGGQDVPLTNERAPTLEEALRYAKPYFIVHIDAKQPGLQADIVALVDRLGMNAQVTMFHGATPASPDFTGSPLVGGVRPVITTTNECGGPFSEDHCMTIPVPDLIDHAPARPIAFNVNFKSHAFLRGVAEARRPATRILSNSLSADHHPLDRLEAEWEAQLAAGSSMIMTNRPKEFLDFLGKREAGQ